MPNPKLPPLLGLTAENIPAQLTQAARWAPWKAIWNEKRQKYDKRPFHPSGYGLSTKRAETWMTYEVALKGYQANPSQFSGIGYLMTGSEDIVGIDLDRCVSPDGIAPWAAEIVKNVGSYAELSPSGKGLRIFATGQIEYDWTNHDLGVEMYAGHTARFLTVTGARLPDSPSEISPAPEMVLAALAARYAKERETATVISLAMPDLVPALLLPDPETLDLPHYTHDFLREGTCRADRSNEIFATAIALYQTGMDEATVFSMLVSSPIVFDIALDKRRQDYDRAMLYLWVEHAQKAKGKASRVASLDDFDVIPEPVGPDGKPQLKFNFKQAALYAQLNPIAWAVKKVLPLAEIGVIYGASGAGKSFFALDLVMAVARGVEWRGNKVRQCNVAYVCAEGAGGFAMRVKAYAEHNSVDLATVPLHILGDAPNITEMSDVSALVAAIKSLGRIGIVVLDTWAQVTAGADENSGKDMGKALGHCKILHAKTNAMVLLLAHSGKDESRGVRGWSGMPAAFDASICIERSGEYRSATIKKAKDGPGEGDEYAFKLESVVLGQDEDGDDITSCVLHADAVVAKAKRKEEPKGSVQQVVLRKAIDLTDLPGAVHTTQLIDAAITEIPTEDGKRDQRRKNVLRAIEALVAANRLRVTNGDISVL